MNIVLSSALACAVTGTTAASQPRALQPGATDAGTSTETQVLMERLEAVEAELEAIRVAADGASSGSVSPNVFNPTISIFGSGLYRFDHRAVVLDEGARVDNTFNLREVEADFRASVDPFADGVAIVSLGSEIPGEFAAEIEEAYVVLRRLPLPVLDEPPLGLTLKLGRFRTDLGPFNRLHLHDLPHIFRPLVIEEFYSAEGLVGNGASARILLPTPWENSSLEFLAEVVSAGGVPIADAPPRFPGFIGSLRSFSVVSDEHQLTVSAIAHVGRAGETGESSTVLYGADFLYKWKPLRHGEYRSFLLGGEILRAELSERPDPFGYFAFAQIQLSRSAYFGARWDDATSLSDVEIMRRAISAYLTLYASEFLRLRFGYEHQLKAGEAEVLHSAFAELTFVIGAHPPEPFWVNR